jgi:hypothetical protein
LVKEIIDLVPESPQNIVLGDFLLKNFDRRPKFTFYENKIDEMPKFLEECKQFLSIAISKYVK